MSEALERLTAVFDPVAFVRKGKPWAGVVSTVSLPRIAGLVVEPAELAWQVVPERQPDGRAGCLFHLHGSVTLLCPRCLGTAVWPVAIEQRVVWYRTEAAVPEEELEADEWDARVMDEPVTLAELLEEELLLAWPQGALHEGCALPGPAVAGAPLSPFSLLR